MNASVCCCSWHNGSPKVLPLCAYLHISMSVACFTAVVLQVFTVFSFFFNGPATTQTSTLSVRGARPSCHTLRAEAAWP